MTYWDELEAICPKRRLDYIVRNYGGSSQSLKLHPFQKRYVEFLDTHEKVIFSKFRRGGFTTLTAFWNLEFALNNAGTHILYLTSSRSCAAEVREKVRYACEVATPAIACPIDHYSISKMSFENGSTMEFISASQFRDFQNISNVIVDEAAWFNSSILPQIMQDLMRMATIERWTIMSTQNTYPTPFSEALDAARGEHSEFGVFDCHYSEHPDYNAEWAERTRHSLGNRAFMSEYEGLLDSTLVRV